MRFDQSIALNCMRDDKYFKEMFQGYDLLAREAIKTAIGYVLRERLGNQKLARIKTKTKYNINFYTI